MDVKKELTDEVKRARNEIIHKIVAKAQSIIIPGRWNSDHSHYSQGKHPETQQIKPEGF